MALRSLGRRARMGGAALLVLLLLAEVGVRSVEPRLEPPQDWYSASTQRLVRDMDTLRAEGAAIDLVLAGTSQTNTDLLPDVFEQELSSVGRAANVGQAAATTRITRRWLLDQVVPRLEPQKVVWGVSSLDFNTNRRPNTYALYSSTRGGRRDLLGRIDRKLARHSALVRHRKLLARPGDFLTDVRNGPPRPDPTPFDRLAKRRAPDTRDKGRRELRRIAGTVLHDYEIGVREVAAFRATLERLRAEGIEVAVVLLPVPAPFIAAHPRGATDFAAFEATVGAVSTETGTFLLDFTHAFPDTAFRDFTHLLEGPAARLSRDVARELEERGW